jgi:hypothetical protein
MPKFVRIRVAALGLVAHAGDDLVATRWSFTSTSGAAPTTTTLLCTETDISRIEDGLLAELWQESVSCGKRKSSATVDMWPHIAVI